MLLVRVPHCLCLLLFLYSAMISNDIEAVLVKVSKGLGF
jgi:hypothetical protein